MVFHVAINQIYVLDSVFSEVKKESLQTPGVLLLSRTTSMKSQCKKELAKGR